MGSTLRSWRLPVAIAAVLVLSVSVVTLRVKEGGVPQTEVTRQASPPARVLPQREIPSNRAITPGNSGGSAEGEAAKEVRPEKIQALRREGRNAEADDLLSEFRKRFPDYPVPAALQTNEPENRLMPAPVDPKPEPPREPETWECCQSGCDPCVYDRYWDALADYEQALSAWRARNPIPANANPDDNT